MPYWKPLFVDGREYSLTHLEPFVFHSALIGHQEVIEITVKFNNHCFSKDYSHSTDSLLPVGFFAKTEKRAFDYIRYELSKELPDIIKTLPARKVKSTRYGEFVIVENRDGIRYAVFFNLRRHSRREATLFVMSAYPIADNNKKIAVTGEMRFTYLLSKLMKKERPNFPKSP